MHQLAGRVAAWLLVLGVAGCGGGGGLATTDAPPTGSGPPPAARPDIVLLMVSGHEGLFDTAPSQSYLQYDAGPEIEDDLASAGLTVETAYFVDDAFPVGGYGGYYDLVTALEYVRDTWTPHGSRVVIVAHSHGGVWAHAAVRAVPSLPIACQVDLDCSSYGWGTVGHTSQNAHLGGEPRGAYNLGFVVSYAAYPSVPSEQTGTYDLEDVVFNSVERNLDVRSGDAPLGGEWYDEKWNLRANTTTTGLYGYYSGTSHEEVHTYGGSTLAYVRAWLRARLGV